MTELSNSSESQSLDDNKQYNTNNNDNDNNTTTATSLLASTVISFDPVVTITTSDNVAYKTYKSTLMNSNYFYTMYNKRWLDNVTYDIFIDRDSTIVNILLLLLKYNNINVCNLSQYDNHILHQLISDIDYYQLNQALVPEVVYVLTAIPQNTHTHIDMSIQCNICYTDCRAGKSLYWCIDHFYIPLPCSRKAKETIRLCCKCYGKAYINATK